VDDELYALKSALCLRAQKTVSIGDDANPHAGPKSN
jgi:hypothetical protein